MGYGLIGISGLPAQKHVVWDCLKDKENATAHLLQMVEQNVLDLKMIQWSARVCFVQVSLFLKWSILEL